jgi:outer membrane protease
MNFPRILFPAALSFFLSSARLYAFPFASLSGYGLSITPEAGLLWGRAAELIYRDEASDILSSELLWNFKSLWYFGTAFEYAQKNYASRFGFFTALDLKCAVPAQIAGDMEDRDWLGPAGELTHYSRHENRTDNFFAVDFSGGLDIPTPLGSLLTFRLSAGVSYMVFSWTAYDGYLRYAALSGGTCLPLDDDDPVIPVNGSVVSFSQDWLFMPMGLSVSVFPGRLFSGNLSFHSGPILKYLGQDEHHLKVNSGQYAEYRDAITGGYILRSAAEVSFSPVKRFSLSLRFSWQRLAAKPHGASGGAATGYLGDHAFQTFDNLSGAAVRTADLSLGLRFYP